MRSILLAFCLAGCAGSGLSLEPPVDNEDARGDIPPAPAVQDRDDRQDDENPYDGEEEQPADEPSADPPEDPIDDPVDDPVDPPPGPVDPPPEPVDPPPPADPCPAGVICIDTLPYVDTNTTTGAPSSINSYTCDASIDESGPERVYQIELTEPGFLAVTLFGLPAGVDVDVHLLQTDGGCIDRGHWDAASLLEAGTYTVVVDSWVNSSGVAQDGAYSVRFHQTRYNDLTGDGLSTTAMQRALVAFDHAWSAGQTTELLYTVLDFDLPSTQPRLWTFSLATGDLFFNELVSHGSNSTDPNDPSRVSVLSNINGSHQSSVGLMRTAETYTGSKGYSLRLDGLESGFNDAVRPRAIVIHGATYATQSFVNANGYLGRSWGCPAIDPAIHQQLIDTVKNGKLFFIHFSDPTWLNTSDYL